MPIHNQIFDSYRLEVKEINEAIKLLLKHDYKVINQNNELIHNDNIDKI